MTQEHQKFLFDRLNFDNGPGYVPEHPPEPTFTLAEHEAAYAKGMADGRAATLREAQESRDQKIVELTQKISNAATQLLIAEVERSKKFEIELIQLASALFQKAYPLLNTAYGLDQILDTIKNVMSTLDEKAVVTVESSTDDLNELSDRLKTLILNHNGQITILPNTDLTTGTCHLKWQDGGMIRDINETANKIVAALQETLKTVINSQN